MNYVKIYDQIIERAKHRNLQEYSESHHILPKCVGGGNEYTNLVELTAREHFLVHWILTKIYKNNFKILCAWNSFCMTTSKNNSGRVVSHLYERCRLKFIEAIHLRKTTHPEWYENFTSSSVNKRWINKDGKNLRVCEEEKQQYIDEGWVIGRTKHVRRPASAETKTKISDSNTGKKRPDQKRGDERSEKQKLGDKISSERRKGRKMLPHQVAKGVAGRKGKPRKPKSEETRKNLSVVKSEKIVCPHCGIIGQCIVMKRWHFDNCKSLVSN